LQVGLVQIIPQLEGTACTSLAYMGSGASILWLMDIGMNVLSTTQGLGHHWLGSFQALADAMTTMGIGTVHKFLRYICSLMTYYCNH
jgi:hypothetical protein